MESILRNHLKTIVTIISLILLSGMTILWYSYYRTNLELTGLIDNQEKTISDLENTIDTFEQRKDFEIYLDSIAVTMEYNQTLTFFVRVNQIGDYDRTVELLVFGLNSTLESTEVEVPAQTKLFVHANTLGNHTVVVLASDGTRRHYDSFAVEVKP